MEQNDATLGQTTAQEGGAEATTEDRSELESDFFMFVCLFFLF